MADGKIITSGGEIVESLGHILSKAREEKGWTVSDLENLTRISRKFIQALEKEDYNILPGEIYVKGFLRNVAEKLDLNPDEILAMYKRTRLSEEPTPYEQLLDEKGEGGGKKKAAGWVIGVAIVAILAAIGVTIVIITGSFPTKDPSPGRRDSAPKNEKVRTITESSGQIQVKENDVIHFTPLGLSATIKIVEVGNTVKANVNDQEVAFSISKPLLADLNRNGIDDFKMELEDVFENVAIIRLEKRQEGPDGTPVVTEDAMGETIPESEPEVQPDEGTKPYNPDIKTAVPVGDTLYVARNVDKKPIAVELSAKSTVYIRYFIDSERPKVESLVAGQKVTLSAENTVILNIGNKNNVEVLVNGVYVDISKGSDNRIANKTIKWTTNPDDETKYNLVVVNTQ